MPASAHDSSRAVSACRARRAMRSRSRRRSAARRQPSRRRGAFRAAVEVGVVRIDEAEGIHFEHPLLAAAIYESASPSGGRAAHRRLIDGSDDPETRAGIWPSPPRGPDESVAASSTRPRHTPPRAAPRPPPQSWRDSRCRRLPLKHTRHGRPDDRTRPPSPGRRRIGGVALGPGRLRRTLGGRRPSGGAPARPGLQPLVRGRARIGLPPRARGAPARARSRAGGAHASQPPRGSGTTATWTGRSHTPMPQSRCSMPTNTRGRTPGRSFSVRTSASSTARATTRRRTVVARSFNDARSTGTTRARCWACGRSCMTASSRRAGSMSTGSSARARRET